MVPDVGQGRVLEPAASASGGQDATRILTINTGSSSLKAALYSMDSAEQKMLDLQVERIGSGNASMVIRDRDGAVLPQGMGDLSSHSAALDAVLGRLKEHAHGDRPGAVGHRVVHGGERYRNPQVVSPEVVAALRELIPIDPEHLPQAIDGVEATMRAFQDTPQVLCFDTAFHQHMPRVAQMYALPRHLEEGGLRRFGFHGLSYEYIMGALRSLGDHAAGGRVIIAHLGNGASMAAVRDGVGIETTMGFTPAGGLVMGTRSGDLDPGVLLYLLQSEGMTAAEVNALVNHRAGLLGVSGTSADMQDLLGAEAIDGRAAEAVQLFCYQARKFVGALTAALGGLDTLVFTGGMGEHAAPIRRRICQDLGFLGITLDAERNTAHASIISPEGSPVTVRVIATDEDLTIARHTLAVLQKGASEHVHL